MECPRCGQGPIQLVRFGRTDLVIRKCEECDAVWAESTIPTRPTFIQFQTLLDILGEQEADVEITVLGTFRGPDELR